MERFEVFAGRGVPLVDFRAGFELRRDLGADACAAALAGVHGGALDFGAAALAGEVPPAVLAVAAARGFRLSGAAGRLRYPTGDLDAGGRGPALRLPACGLGGDAAPLLAHRAATLEVLDLRRNAAPDLAALPGLARLRVLHLGRCGLRGAWPLAAGDALAALERLDLGHNRLDGAAPDPAGWPRLRRYAVARNRFDAPAAAALVAAMPPALAACDLSDNPLPPGPCPAALPPALAVLRLNGVGLSGPVDAVAELNALAVLELADNAIAAVPPALGDLAGLRVLRLDGNLLTAIPPALGKLAGTLRRCSLHGNNIVGSLGALGALATASMGDDDDADAASSEDDDECDVY